MAFEKCIYYRSTPLPSGCDEENNQIYTATIEIRVKWKGFDPANPPEVDGAVVAAIPTIELSKCLPRNCHSYWDVLRMFTPGQPLNTGENTGITPTELACVEKDPFALACLCNMFVANVVEDGDQRPCLETGECIQDYRVTLRTRSHPGVVPERRANTGWSPLVINADGLCILNTSTPPPDIPSKIKDPRTWCAVIEDLGSSTSDQPATGVEFLSYLNVEHGKEKSLASDKYCGRLKNGTSEEDTVGNDCLNLDPGDCRFRPMNSVGENFPGAPLQQTARKTSFSLRIPVAGIDSWVFELFKSGFTNRRCVRIYSHERCFSLEAKPRTLKITDVRFSQRTVGCTAYFPRCMLEDDPGAIPGFASQWEFQEQDETIALTDSQRRCIGGRYYAVNVDIEHDPRGNFEDFLDQGPHHCCKDACVTEGDEEKAIWCRNESSDRETQFDNGLLCNGKFLGDPNTGNLQQYCLIRWGIPSIPDFGTLLNSVFSRHCFAFCDYDCECDGLGGGNV